MSKFGFHVGLHPTGIADIFRETAAANSPIPIVFALDNNIASVRNEYSPTTKIVYRDQRYGPDNGNMYAGTLEEAHLAGHAWVAKLIPIWKLNPANFYAPINESGRGDVIGLQWYNAFSQGCMDEAQEAGLKLCIGEWSTGMPPLDSASILAILPMLKQAAQNGHILGLHEYSLEGPMIGSPLCLRYRQLYALLPADARPQLVISEAGPDAGYGTGYELQAYVDVVGQYDLEVMKDSYCLGLCAFNYGSSESDLTPAIPLIQKWIIDHPTPIDDQPTLEQRVTALETQAAANEVAHFNIAIDQQLQDDQLTALTKRVEALEHQPPPAPVTTVTLEAYPTTITQGQSLALRWTSTNALSITSNFGAVSFSGEMTMMPALSVMYTITAHGAGNDATAQVAIVVNPAPPIFRWRGVGVGDNQPLTQPVLSAFEISKVNACKLFTMPDAGLMNAAINAIRAKRPDTFIVARMFFSVNPGVKFSPADFVAFCKQGLQAAYAAGVRYFEVHNEPNLTNEGYGTSWTGGAEFGAWLRGVLALVRPLCPDAKWGYPGLSPQSNTLQFLNESEAGIAACDWMGAHSYFQNDGATGWGMTSLDGGYYWKRVLTFAQGKPLIVTEFSCNTPAVDYATKGAWYKRYYDLVSQESGIVGAFCFALSWPGSDPNREGWVYKNQVTAIPAAVSMIGIT